MLLKPATTRLLTISTILYLLIWQLLNCLLPIKPFWRDEWCMIDNLKFKTPAQLLGKLDYTQQFPRVLLQIYKQWLCITDFSYFGLRFGSFMLALCCILIANSIRKSVFANATYGYVFLLIIIGNPMFIDYFTQTKHYIGELLAALVAIWQLMKFIQLQSAPLTKPILFLLFLSLIFTPFTSYTYPIAFAPVFFVILPAFIRNTHFRLRILPLLLCSVIGISIFYFVDVSQVLQDKNMYGFWHLYLLEDNTPSATIALRLWSLFAKMGAGLLFEIILGILSVSAFICTIPSVYSYIQQPIVHIHSSLRVYAFMLIVFMISLYLSSHLPLGQAKFSLFAIPAMSLLLLLSLSAVCQHYQCSKLNNILLLVLTIAFSGNVFTSVLPTFTNTEYKKQIAIYNQTQNAIKLARAKNIPIAVTPAIGYPDDITTYIKFLTMPSAAGIIRTFPAYSISNPIQVYDILNPQTLGTKV